MRRRRTIIKWHKYIHPQWHTQAFWWVQRVVMWKVHAETKPRLRLKGYIMWKFSEASYGEKSSHSQERVGANFSAQLSYLPEMHFIMVYLPQGNPRGHFCSIFFKHGGSMGGNWALPSLKVHHICNVRFF